MEAKQILNVEEIRKDFPILKSTIYLDSGATSLTPIQVTGAINEYYNKYNANIHRALHKLSEKATKEYELAHQKVAQFINSNFNEIIFTKNTTESLNLLAYTLIKNLKEVLNKTNMRSSVRNLIMDEGRNTVSSRFFPIEALRMLSELGENATRLGEFKRAQSKLKKRKDFTDFDVNTESAFRAREVTDFARMGSKMQGANMLVAFLNAITKIN